MSATTMDTLGSSSSINHTRRGRFQIKRSGDFGAGRACGGGCGDLCADAARGRGLGLACGFFDELFLFRGVFCEDRDEVGGDGAV